jgi:hypothetical protein
VFLPVAKGTPGTFGAIGNWTTCQISGFLLQFSMSKAVYWAFICLYYIMMVKYRVRDEKIDGTGCHNVSSRQLQSNKYCSRSLFFKLLSGKLFARRCNRVWKRITLLHVGGDQHDSHSTIFSNWFVFLGINLSCRAENKCSLESMDFYIVLWFNANRAPWSRYSFKWRDQQKFTTWD